LTAVRAISVVEKIVEGETELSGATSRYSFEQETVKAAARARTELSMIFFFIFFDVFGS